MDSESDSGWCSEADGRLVRVITFETPVSQPEAHDVAQVVFAYDAQCGVESEGTHELSADRCRLTLRMPAHPPASTHRLFATKERPNVAVS